MRPLSTRDQEHTLHPLPTDVPSPPGTPDEWMLQAFYTHYPNVFPPLPSQDRGLEEAGPEPTNSKSQGLSYATVTTFYVVIWFLMLGGGVKAVVHTSECPSSAWYILAQLWVLGHQWISERGAQSLRVGGLE